MLGKGFFCFFFLFFGGWGGVVFNFDLVSRPETCQLGGAATAEARDLVRIRHDS